MKKYLSFGLLVMVCCIAGCKKEEQKCPSSWFAVIEQTVVNDYCASTGLLDSSAYLYFSFSPNQTARNMLQLRFFIKNELGTQYLNSSDSSRGVWIYDRHSPNKIYGINGPNAHATVTVTGIDSINQITTGQFSATLVEENSLSDSIRVKDGSFSITYELW